MKIQRRTFLKQSTLGAAALGWQTLVGKSFFIHRSPSLRPQITGGVSAGDVLADRAMIWARSDRPSNLWVDWSTDALFRNKKTISGPAADISADFTSKLDLRGLPEGQQVFYQVRFQSMEDREVWSEGITGSFRTAPTAARNIRFLWSGDTCGQGYGINPEIGGMRIYETMRLRQPDFFIHSGDTIYADNPIPEKIELPDGRVWRNLTTPAKSKVAETLQEFRGNYQYNLLDNNLRAFNAEVPILYQWDDHEVLNNWYPQEILEDSRYSEKRVSVLAARSKQAFLEYNPVRSNGEDAQRLFRKIPYGPLLDVFIIDMRSYRGPNGANLQTTTSADTDFLGKKQVEWLKKALQASKATWKVIASDMPIGLMVYDDYVHKNTFENSSNGDGPPLGRELEMAALLRFIRRHQIQNVVWLTADVHYTAAHYYQPNRARFTDFLPFYEFVSGPLNAGTFGPGDLDNTFGPEVLFYKAPPPGQANLSPLSGMQFFGEVEIDALSKAMRVTLRDMSGASLYVKEINAQ